MPNVLNDLLESLIEICKQTIVKKVWTLRACSYILLKNILLTPLRVPWYWIDWNEFVLILLFWIKHFLSSFSFNQCIISLCFDTYSQVSIDQYKCHNDIYFPPIITASFRRKPTKQCVGTVKEHFSLLNFTSQSFCPRRVLDIMKTEDETTRQLFLQAD